ncbi:hypothetical protein [Candidatus Palauibacter sp.]|uniref:hypothetical protein n=1 Tax=Candidatus Palauibacter sp. TaxID=3101350 RepID=UPI003B59D5E6
METEVHDPHIDYPTLNRFADGELTGRAYDAVQSHLRSCAVSRGHVQFIRSLGSAIRALPAPRPPDDLYDLLFGEEPNRPKVLAFPAGDATPVESSRASWLRIATGGIVVGLALIISALLLTVGSDRVMAGSSTLTLEPARGGAMALRYETISPLAAETSVRVRIRYWVSDSLRFAQNEGGFSAVELSRSAAGTFEGVVDVPPGTVYAAATVEDLGGTYLDSDFGRFWEYLETDAEGRPTLEARRYQILAALDFNVPRAASLAGEAASEFPGQPEFWLWLLSFEGTALPATEPPLSAHMVRLGRLDRVARDGNPGPVEIDALSRYARLLGRADIAEYWWGQLRARYPRHGAAAQVNLQAVLLSEISTESKVEVLEEDWARVGAPVTARVGLRYSYELADPTLTERWLRRHATSSWGRTLSSDTDAARSMMEVPVLWPLAEPWILDRLSNSHDWLSSARRLDQSRYAFEAETRQNRAHLDLQLSRIRLGRSDLAGGVEALERSVEEAWNPAVFVQAAEIHRSLGSDLRADQLVAMALVDPVVPRVPYRSTEDDTGWRGQRDTQEAAARVMRERITTGLLDEHVNLNVRLRTAIGDEVTLEQAVDPGRGVTLVLYTTQPGLVPDETVSLLGLNSERLASAGVRTVFVSQQPDPSQEGRHGIASEFYLDPDFRVWEALGAWRGLQYFVLDRSGRLRHRGEGLEAALRISLALTM